MPNPFYYGGHVSPEQFVGRKAELQRIFAALEVAHSGQIQSISVVGPRRIGKSSLLFYVANRYATRLQNPANYRVAYVDLQDADCKTLDGLLRKILTALQINAPRGALDLPKFQNAILAVKGTPLYPVVCLDEFEELFDKQDIFTNDLYDSWRHLMNENVIAFITASKSSLDQLAASKQYTSPFFNIFTYLPLGELTDDEAEELMNRGYTCDRPFSRAERDMVAQLAGDHPAKIQIAGSLIYQAKADGNAVDFDTLRRDFEQQLARIGLEEPLLTKRVAVGTKRAFFGFVPSLGRFVLEMIFRKKKGEYSESNELWAGWTAIILLLAILFGLLPVSIFQVLFK